MIMMPMPSAPTRACKCWQRRRCIDAGTDQARLPSPRFSAKEDGARCLPASYVSPREHVAAGLLESADAGQADKLARCSSHAVGRGCETIACKAVQEAPNSSTSS
mmetsp:Transcript_64318/g.88979  ORF Transcript_64318/g.88979 Transcript_64318/m.88979 type:complete len:105 (+) Transcript_64318:87-401(+)